MRFCLLIGLLLPATLWARDDRPALPPTTCAGELLPLTEIDDATAQNPHLLMRGTLTRFVDPRGRSGMAIRDREAAEMVTPDAEVAYSFLQPGDELYLYTSGGAVEVEGLLEPEGETGKLQLVSHGRVVLNKKALKAKVASAAHAMLVRALAPGELADLRAKIAPWLRRYRAYQGSSDRSVTIGNRRVERAHFEKFFEGAVKFQYEGDGLRLWVQTQGEWLELGEGDRVFLFDRGRMFFEGRLPKNLIDLRNELLRADTAAAFTRPF